MSARQFTCRCKLVIFWTKAPSFHRNAIWTVSTLQKVRVYILEDLKKQLATLEEKIMANVEDSLSGIATEMAYSYRCHIFHGPYGNITGCGGTPYDCLCVVVTAPPNY